MIGTREELARQELTAGRANWLVDPPGGPFRCQVKIRYRSHPVQATVEVLNEGRFHATLDDPCVAIVPVRPPSVTKGSRFWAEDGSSNQKSRNPKHEIRNETKNPKSKTERLGI